MSSEAAIQGDGSYYDLNIHFDHGLAYLGERFSPRQTLPEEHFSCRQEPFIDAVLLAMLKDGMNPHDIARRAYSLAEAAISKQFPGAKPIWMGDPELNRP